jgi:hypothetical protein
LEDAQGAFQTVLPGFLRLANQAIQRLFRQKVSHAFGFS